MQTTVRKIIEGRCSPSEFQGTDGRRTPSAHARILLDLSLISSTGYIVYSLAHENSAPHLMYIPIVIAALYIGLVRPIAALPRFGARALMPENVPLG
jgi:hypothetical protein